MLVICFRHSLCRCRVLFFSASSSSVANSQDIFLGPFEVFPHLCRTFFSRRTLSLFVISRIFLMSAPQFAVKPLHNPSPTPLRSLGIFLRMSGPFSRCSVRPLDHVAPLCILNFPISTSFVFIFLSHFCPPNPPRVSICDHISFFSDCDSLPRGNKGSNSERSTTVRKFPHPFVSACFFLGRAHGRPVLFRLCSRLPLAPQEDCPPSDQTSPPRYSDSGFSVNLISGSLNLAIAWSPVTLRKPCLLAFTFRFFFFTEIPRHYKSLR